MNKLFLRDRKHSFRFMISIWLSTIMVTASILSFLATNILPYHRANTEFQNMQMKTATTMLELYNSEKLSTDKIIKLASSDMFPIKKIDDLSKQNLDSNEMQKLSKGNLLYKTNLIYGTQYIKLGNDILSITVNAYSNVFLSTVRTNGFTLLFAILLGMLLTSLTFKRMLGTFSMVIEAIQEVSKGNFDTKLPIKHAHGSGLSFVNSFNKMTTELSKMETLRNDFISNVSHEFKTPISSIQGFATLLSQSDLSEEQMEYAKIIASESSRLANLSANILKLTKLQNQEIVTEKQLFALDEQLRQCLLILEKKWEDKNINLEIFLDEIKCYGNKELLEQVWINLIDNAIKYTNISGTIILSCTQDNDNIIVSIKDDGIGMNKNSQGRIFEKFYQGDKAHNSEGNGLGLSLVKRIVDLCNGTIEFESEENKGTTFVVSLPIENS